MRVLNVRNLFKLPRNYEEGMDWGTYWGGKLYTLGAPVLVSWVLLQAHQKPYAPGTATYLGLLLGLTGALLLGRLLFFVSEVRQMRVHLREHSKDPLRPCSAPCGCGCGRTVAEEPLGACGKPCSCGCTRPCVVHVDHRGECGS